LTVTDIIGGKNANDPHPNNFEPDRLGNSGGAIRLRVQDVALTLPAGNYIEGDTTITMWVIDYWCGAYYGTKIF
jgi:hypothetical protein